MRKRFCGYDKDGIPLWLLYALEWIDWDGNRGRSHRRLIRMLNVNRATRVRLAITTDLLERVVSIRLQPGQDA